MINILERGFFMDGVTTAITTVISWLGAFVDALFGTDGALAPLLPFFIVGIAISAVLLGVKVVRSLVWGA